MNDKVSIVFRIPSLLFLFFRMYLKLRRAQRSYLKKFRNTLDTTTLEVNVRDKIYGMEKELIGKGFSEIMKTIRM